MTHLSQRCFAQQIRSAALLVALNSLLTSSAACDDGKLQLVRGWTGVPICEYVNFTPDGKSVVASGTEIVVWEVATGKEVRRFKDQGSACSISRDGRHFLVATIKAIKMGDLGTGKIIRQFTVLGGGPLATAFSPDGRYSGSSRTGTDLSVRVTYCD